MLTVGLVFLVRYLYGLRTGVTYIDLSKAGAVGSGVSAEAVGSDV